MEKDILNYSPTVMFRGTPCIINFRERERKIDVKFRHTFYRKSDSEHNLK